MLLILGLQLVGLLVFMELFVAFMPTSLRQASLHNCYRVDGTLSSRRSYRERRGTNRLRGELLMLFSLILLTGNGLYFFIDLTLVPTSTRAAALSLFSWNLEAWMESMRQSANKEQLINGGLWAMFLTMVWSVGCIAVVWRGTRRAYKEFAKGVEARRRVYFDTDMARLSMSDSQFTERLMRAQRQSREPSISDLGHEQ